MPIRGTGATDGATFYVATNGNDAWTGKLPDPQAADGPFATLERARNEIRSLKQAGRLRQGGVTVEVRGGVYELARPLELTAEDSGSEGAPIIYRARRGEDVRLIGGWELTNFVPVTSPVVLNRLDPSARGKVWQAANWLLRATMIAAAWALGATKARTKRKA